MQTLRGQMSNNQGNNELAVGVMIFVAIAIALMVAGAILALIGVTVYVFNAWRKIYRYEGKDPVLWLAGITAFFALFCISGALEEFRIFKFYLQNNGQGEKVILHGFITVSYLGGMALPTVVYEIYRAIKPISHIKIGMVETLRDLYRQGNITRLERNAQLAKLIAIDDDEIERRHTETMRQQQAPRQTGGAAFDVPEQD